MGLIDILFFFVASPNLTWFVKISSIYSIVILNFCQLSLFQVQNDHHLELPSCINFLISLCKPILIDTGVDKALKIGCNPLALPLGADISRLDSNFTAIHSKVQDIQPSCKEPIPSASHGADVCKLELCHKWISLLTPENACLSGIFLEGLILCSKFYRMVLVLYHSDSQITTKLNCSILIFF